MKKDVIEFVRSKDYKFIKEIGQGGTGKTVLLKDEMIDEFFVCKKYSPFYSIDKEKYFKNFIQEIKILYSLYHKNVVRVYNYYLYPEKHTGYILMEYIKGKHIYDYITNNPDRLNDVFQQTIEGFLYLESNTILHRDIRPENILVYEGGIVKIIDFGFGKIIDFNNNYDKSISLNWRFSVPNEFEKSTYDSRTEVYFVGKLFEEIIQSLSLDNFTYKNILKLMTNPDYSSRIQSFFEVSRNLTSNSVDNLEFTEQEKETYQIFATSLLQICNRKSNNVEYISDIDKIIIGLETIYRNSLLENIVQNPYKLLNCFFRGEFYYNNTVELHTFLLKNFITLIKSVSDDKKKIILNNLWQRFDKITTYTSVVEDEDLPF